MPKAPRNFKYLLVVVDTFPGWVEALCRQMEGASEIVPVLLKDLISRYGLPDYIQNDNGASCISEVTPQVSKMLQIKWKLHASWRP